MNRWTSEPEEDYEEVYAEAEHEHMMHLWDIATIFENIGEGEDTKYSDFSQAMYNNWKVVTFDMKVYIAAGTGSFVTRNNSDLFAVLR